MEMIIASMMILNVDMICDSSDPIFCPSGLLSRITLLSPSRRLRRDLSFVLFSRACVVVLVLHLVTNSHRRIHRGMCFARPSLLSNLDLSLLRDSQSPFISEKKSILSLCSNYDRSKSMLTGPLHVLIVALLVSPAAAWTSLKPSNSYSFQTVLKMTVTSDIPKPKLPIPGPICSDKKGTWAYDTMSRRVDEEILQRTFEDNQEAFETEAFKPVLERFQQLREELRSSSKLTMLDDLPADASETRMREWNEWKEILQPFLDKGDTWLSAPWMVTEFYVYRRLIQAIGFWDEGTAGYMYDPFVKQKRAGLESSVGSAEPMLEKIPNLPKTAEGIDLAASIALWGNKMDLSIWPADAANADIDIFSSILESATENLLHDDLGALAEHCESLRSKGGGMVDIIVDNAGFELITDLALAQHLLESGIASCVTFQLKSHPTFVSDALEKDLLEHVEHYAALDPSKYPNAQKAGEKWKQFLKEEKWKCQEDNFWVQAYAMWDMTEPLRSNLRDRCDLAFVKGDANYRRLLGDRMWDLTAPFSDVVGAYFPCPVCALRTLKAEIGCGMDAAQIEKAKKLDDNWQVNGRFGVVHFGKGAGR